MAIKQSKKKNAAKKKRKPAAGKYSGELLPDGISVEELRRAKALNIPLERLGFDYYVHKIIQIQSGERLDRF